MTNNSQKGFTLVELSIVLVIIGLLVSGILVAQSMIGTTKTQALIRQIASYDTAVSNFYTKFNGLPGDTASFHSGTGDGDALISASGATGGTAKSSKSDGEISYFWKDLSISGLSTEGAGLGNNPPNTYAQLTGVMSVGTTTATNPKAKLGSANAGFITAGVTTTSSVAATGNWYIVLDAAQTAASNAWAAQTSGTGALKAADALAIDTKLDDGVTNTGNVQVALFGAGVNIAIPGGVAGTGCTATAYDVTKTTSDCDIAIRMGINTGNLQ